MAAWAQTGKEESGDRSKPFSCMVTSVYAWNENTARAPKCWTNKGLPLPDSLAAKKQMPRCRVKVQLFPVIFYFQMSSACSQFPEPHNLHYKYVWTQITLSRSLPRSLTEAESAQLCSTQSYYFIRWPQGVAFSPVCKADIAKTHPPRDVCRLLWECVGQGNGPEGSACLTGRGVYHAACCFSSTWPRALCLFTH